MQVAEMRAPAQQFTQHQRRPTLGEDFSALGDRAKLTVTLHGHPPVLLGRRPQDRCVRRCHKSKIWTGKGGPHDGSIAGAYRGEKLSENLVRANLSSRYRSETGLPRPPVP